MHRAEKLTDLPNIGATIAKRLDQAGVKTPADLRVIGSVAAALRVRTKADGNVPCPNMLYALEGAIRGLRWHEIPSADRARLWQAYVARTRAAKA